MDSKIIDFPTARAQANARRESQLRSGELVEIQITVQQAPDFDS